MGGGAAAALAKRRATVDASALRYAVKEAELALTDHSFVPQATVTSKFKFKTTKLLASALVADKVDHQALSAMARERAHQPAAAVCPTRRGTMAGTPEPVMSSTPTPSCFMLRSGTGGGPLRAASSMSVGSAALVPGRAPSPLGSVDEVLPHVVLHRSRSPVTGSDGVDPGWATLTMHLAQR
jgi:hypothetical protein